MKSRRRRHVGVARLLEHRCVVDAFGVFIIVQQIDDLGIRCPELVLDFGRYFAFTDLSDGVDVVVNFLANRDAA